MRSWVLPGSGWFAGIGPSTARPVGWSRCLPYGGPATGVRTTGLRWALAGETLEVGSTRGVSNVFSAPEATVALDAGTLLAVRP